MTTVSKTEFKAKALEIMRNVEQSGEPVIITDRNKPTLEVRKLRQQKTSALEALKGSVIFYEGATEPVGDDDWENA